MDKAQANRIKDLRCGPICHSWRRIAEIIVQEYFDEYDADLSGNQLVGKDLCNDAARCLGEDPSAEEWN